MLSLSEAEQVFGKTEPRTWGLWRATPACLLGGRAGPILIPVDLLVAVDGPSPSHGAREARGREERVAARRCSVVFPSIRMNQELWSVQRLCESMREGGTEEDLAWTWAEEGARCREGRPWWCFPASPEIGADQPRASSRVNHRASSCQFAASLHGKKTPVAARAGGPACSLNKKGVPLSREGLIKLTRRGSLSVSPILLAIQRGRWVTSPIALGALQAGGSDPQGSACPGSPWRGTEPRCQENKRFKSEQISVVLSF